jgi:hypothetical protein
LQHTVTALSSAFRDLQSDLGVDRFVSERHRNGCKCVIRRPSGKQGRPDPNGAAIAFPWSHSEAARDRAPAQLLQRVIVQMAKLDSERDTK